jgi:beta-alanine degradation protein BauB
MRGAVKPLTALALLFAATVVAHAAKITVEIDNAWVRASRVNLAPYEKLPVRDYLASVIVYLSDTGAHRDGDTAYFDAGKRTEGNSTAHPIEEVIVELKPDAPAFPPHRVTLDPVKLDPEHHLVDLENSRVRVLRTILEPHLKSPTHEHPSYVVVYLTELHTTMALSDGRVVDNPRHKGVVAWRDAMQHTTENIGTERAAEIQIELK